MGSYYYLEDPNSESGSISVPEEDYVAAILRIAERNRLQITDKMILEEINKPKRKKAFNSKKAGHQES
ncbi:hypothetical protein FJZ40_02965 [Candidatus Shapirobacteria bacterium]|nr:hypothetical protein [Candidatus Shapirobacteria bacterium]